MNRLFLPLLLFGMFSLVAGQSRFIVNVGAKNGERCSAIILSDRHVLTTAECIDRTSLAVNETVLLVEIHVTAQDPMVDNEGILAWPVPVQNVTFHPDYRTYSMAINNLAVIRLANKLSDYNSRIQKVRSTVDLHSRPFGSLKTNFTCLLYGWGGHSDNPQTAKVIPFNATFCDETQPHVFCSVHSSFNDSACMALSGSPVLCNEGSLDGILLSHNCTIDNQNRIISQYYSLDFYQSWIEENSGAESNRNNLVVLIVASMLTVMKIA